MLLTNFLPNKMELTSKLLEQISFNTRSRLEEHMLIVMDKSDHEQHLSQPFQTNNKQFKLAVIFLSGCNGIFNVTSSKIIFYFKKSITNCYDFIQITIPLGAYKIESLNNEIKGSLLTKDIILKTNIHLG